MNREIWLMYTSFFLIYVKILPDSIDLFDLNQVRVIVNL